MSRSTYSGAEWTRRWLDESRTNAAYSFTVDVEAGTGSDGIVANDRTDVSIDQNLAHYYLYQVLSERSVAEIDYQFTREARGYADDSTLNDHLATLSSRYFFPGGFFLQSGLSYQYQDRSNIVTVSDGSDAGWRFGGGVGYRLPNRHGIVLAEVRNVLGQDIALEQLSGFNQPTSNDPTAFLSARVNF